MSISKPLQAGIILFKFWQKFFSLYQFNCWIHPAQLHARVGDACFCVGEQAPACWWKGGELAGIYSPQNFPFWIDSRSSLQLGWEHSTGTSRAFYTHISSPNIAENSHHLLEVQLITSVIFWITQLYWLRHSPINKCTPDFFFKTLPTDKTPYESSNYCGELPS